MPKGRRNESLKERQAAMRARLAAAEPSLDVSVLDPFSHHHDIKELAAAWGVSRDHIRRLFENEPGVVDIGCGKSRVLRIPRQVAERVYRRCIISPSPTRARRKSC